MKAIWRMNENNWRNYVNDNNSKGKEKFSSDADMYGAVVVGNIRAEFHHTLDNSDWYAFVNVFALGVDDGYGEEDGTPYALLSDAPRVPINANTFEEFKTAFEKDLEAYINTLPSNIINELQWSDVK